jgi:uncharacterized protein (DUF488 family)
LDSKLFKNKQICVDVFSIGHSTRSIEEFLSLLNVYGVTNLVDIRTIPKSRRNPQFNQEALSKKLIERGIKYSYIKGLGGLRRPRVDSINDGWRNPSFRGYADHMQTAEFKDSINVLMEIISREAQGRKETRGKVAFMCAEAVPWRCHRNLLSDALTIRGLHVAHIISRTSANLHKLTPFLKVRGLELCYPEDP